MGLLLRLLLLATFRLGHRKWRRLLAIAGVVTVMAVGGCGTTGAGPAAKASPSASAATPTPSPAKLSAAQKAAVQKILGDSVAHYSGLLTAGEQALGTTQYVDAGAGLAAFNDPNSAASRFSNWRTGSKPEQDISSDAAFSQAVQNYSAENQPDAISSWQADMIGAEADLNAWIRIAVEWQISGATSAQLAAADQKVRADLQTALQDLAATLAAS